MVPDRLELTLNNNFILSANVVNEEYHLQSRSGPARNQSAISTEPSWKKRSRSREKKPVQSNGFIEKDSSNSCKRSNSVKKVSQDEYSTSIDTDANTYLKSVNRLWLCPTSKHLP